MHEMPSPILGASRAAESIRVFARLAASVDAPVLITGETGTGKGVLAAAIHHASARTKGQLVAVNCAGVPESLFESEFFGHARGAFTGASQTRRGLFEQAHGGTLFLDEIGELSIGLQAKLLTTIETGVVRRLGSESALRSDARIVTATGVPLEDAVREGQFRLDLYHRLLVLAFHMPPLRERGSDILLLARHFLCTFAARHARHAGDFDDDAIRLISSHEWPGNIRQLAHAIEAAVLLADGPRVRAADLPRRLLHHTGAGLDDLPERYCFYGTRNDEREQIVAEIQAQRGNLTRVARALGMARNTLRSRMRELEIPTPRGVRRG